MGLGMMVGGQIYQGLAASAMGKSEQARAEYNAEVARRQKQAIVQKGKIKSQLVAEEASRKESTMIVNMSGVTQAGTNLEALGIQGAEDEREQMLIGYDTQVAAQQAESRAELYELEGDIARERGKNVAMGHYMVAGATLLAGLSGGGASGGGGGKNKPSTWPTHSWNRPRQIYRQG
jgi:hypothetical protein